MANGQQQPVPKKRSVALLKDTILNSAQTSHFEVEIIPNDNIKGWIREKVTEGRGSALTATSSYYDRNLKLACNQASLPGLSFATHELTNKYHNVTVKNAYRKTLDQSASFSFYVDTNYDLIYFFENWMSYIMGETRDNYGNTKRSFRAQFPSEYKSSSITITKFERDYRDKVMVYRFLDAYPASIDSMEVSYNSSQILNCTVGFNYTRYTVDSINMETNQTAIDDRKAANQAGENIGLAAAGSRNLGTGANDLAGTSANIA